MALTVEDMVNMREMMEEVITRRVDPRFEELKTEILDEIEVRVNGAVADMSEVIQEGFTLVGERFDAMDERFNGVELRLVRVEDRLDNLKIVSDF